MAAVTVIAGLAGSGKTHRCLMRIVEAIRSDPLGPPIFWVVPKQSTFSMERLLACGSGLEAATRCRVVSFEGLAEEVLAANPGVSRVVVSPLGRLATMGHLLRAHAGELRFFSATARRPGLAGEILQLLDELSRNGSLTRDENGLDALDRASAALADDGDLGNKVNDLRLLRDRYRQFMGEGRFDKDARMEYVLRHTGSTPIFKGATFYIDGFIDFLDFEKKMIVSLCQTAEQTGGSVDITFALPPDYPGLTTLQHSLHKHSVFHRIEAAHLSLRQLLREKQIAVGVEKLETLHRFGKPELLAVERGFAGNFAPGSVGKVEPVTAGAEPGVEMIVAPDHRSELDAVARKIRELTCDPKGPRYRCRDIVVLARSLTPYARELAKCFKEHGIPHFFDRRDDVTAHPLPRLVRATVGLAVSGWETSAVVAMCRSGLLRGCDLELACRIDHWALTRGIEGEVWAMPHPAAPPEIEVFRTSFVAAVAPWLQLMHTGATDAQPPKVRDVCGELLRLLEAMGVRQVLSARVKAARDAGDEHTATTDAGVWETFVAFVEELVDLLGETPITAADFHAILTEAFEALDLGIVPPTVDQVMVGEAERTRVTQAKVVFVIGLADLQFPAAHAESALMSDRQRSRLHLAGVGLEQGADRRQLDERLIAYFAMTRASERLVLSRPTTNPQGTPLSPSPYWSRTESLVRGVPVTVVRGISEAGEVGTSEQWVRSVLRAARTNTLTSSPVMLGLYERLRRAPSDSPAGKIRDKVWSALTPPPGKLRLSQKLAEALYPIPVDLRVDALERFVKCPFQYFVHDVLGVKDVSAPTVDFRQLSGILHGVLAQFTRQLLSAREDADWTDLTEDEARARVSKLAEGVIAAKVKELSYDGSPDWSRLSPRDRQVLRTVQGELALLVSAHREAKARTTFHPESAGMPFGADHPAPPLSLGKDGSVVARVGGSIDRLDTTKEGRIAAWDYAMRADRSVVVPMFHQIDLKLLIDLLVLKESGREVAGALKLGLRTGPESYSEVRKWLEAPLVDSAEYRLARRKGRGIVRQDAVQDFDSGLAPGQTSPLIACAYTKKSDVDQRGTDVLPGVVFDRMLDRARQRLNEVAVALVGGAIDITPYKLGKTSACTRCSYSAACRFNPREGGTYVQLTPTKSAQVVEQLTRAPATSDSALSDSLPPVTP